MNEAMRDEDMDGKDRREWRLPSLLYTDDFVLCGKSDQDLEGMVENFLKIYRSRGLKVNVDKSEVMVLGGRREWSVRSMWMGYGWKKC